LRIACTKWKHRQRTREKPSNNVQSKKKNLKYKVNYWEGRKDSRRGEAMGGKKKKPLGRRANHQKKQRPKKVTGKKHEKERSASGGE